MLNFDFLENGLGLVPPPNFVYDFSRKVFLLRIPLPDQISLSDSLYFLRYWAICVLYLFPVYDINFEINLSFLIKPLFCIVKKVRTNI